MDPQTRQLDLHTGKLLVNPHAFHEGSRQMVRPEQYSGLAYETPQQTHSSAYYQPTSFPAHDIDAVVKGMVGKSTQERENFAMGNNYDFHKDGSDRLNSRRTDSVGSMKEGSADIHGGSDKPQTLKKAGFFH